MAPQTPSMFSIKTDMKASSQNLNDDIDCVAWLSEIDLEQYAETFLTNLSSDGRIILRKRLLTIRQQDLSKMNITNFQHQKEIMQHINLVLKFPFNSPQRRKEVQLFSPDKNASRKNAQKAFLDELNAADEKKGNENNLAQNKGGNDSKGLGAKKVEYSNVKAQLLEKRKVARRRRSFDEAIWNNINNMRNKQTEFANAADNLREGIIAEPKENKVEKAANQNRRRRWSFGEPGSFKPEDINSNFSKAIAYGNLALQYDSIQNELKQLQHEYLNKFITTIKCDKATIYFINEATRDLVFLADGVQWFRVPAGTGLAGSCADTGQCINVPDVYSDFRFNRNIDVRTSFKTRNALCQPVRRSRGAGAVVAVVECVNKKEGKEFDTDDELLLASFSQRIADALAERFKELENCAEVFAGKKKRFKL